VEARLGAAEGVTSKSQGDVPGESAPGKAQYPNYSPATQLFMLGEDSD